MTRVLCAGSMTSLVMVSSSLIFRTRWIWGEEAFEEPEVAAGDPCDGCDGLGVGEVVGVEGLAEGSPVSLEDEQQFVLSQGPVLVGEADSAVELGVVAELLLQAGHAEGPTPTPDKDARRSSEAVAGGRFLLTEPLLRRLFLSWLLFAGAVAAMTPATQIFYLQGLHFTATQYGLLMGLPSLGGLAGAWMTGRITRRWQLGPTVWWSSVLRTPWYLLYPLALPGIPGLVMLLIAFTGVLFFSSVTNSAMSALRMELTPDRLMSRTSAAWSIATTGAGPALIPVIGILTQVTNARTSLWAIFAIVTVSVLALPMRQLRQL